MHYRGVGGYFTLALSLLASLAVQARDAEPAEGESLAVLVEDTGTYSRPVSTDSALAQKFFDQGLRLTWGYYFPSSIASHQEALRHDDHPMFHWGMAVAIAPNPNSRRFGSPDDPHGEGRKAIMRAMNLKDRATEQEQALIDLVSVRYDSDAIPNVTDRDQAYLEAVSDLLGKYPDDPDIAALFADAFMSMTAWDYWDETGKGKPGTEQAAKVLEESMARHPGHPGTNHLYIHLLEASSMPERALPAADRLAALMPNAGHVVHMPGHIYLRVGQYDKAIRTNEKSVLADDVFLKAWGDRALPRIGSANSNFKTHRGHSLSFVRYAASMQGNYALAVDASRRAGSGWRQLTSEWLIHKMFGKWDALLAINGERTDTPYQDGILAYVQGSAHANTGEQDLATESLIKLQSIMTDEAQILSRGSINPQSDLLKIAAFSLEGEIKQAAGDLGSAITAFDNAVKKQDALQYMEPPSWSLPMRHYLGDALLKAGRAAEAEQAFREDLAWNKNNGRGLFGLWQSLTAQNRADEAAIVRKEFDEAWGSADTELTATRF